MNDIIEDLFKVYISCIDSYNSKIYQTINDKYTIIDKAMITAYLYIKIMEDRDERNDESTNVLCNYILKQVIYSETGNISLEINDKSKLDLYNEILDKLILDKFEYKNRIMKKLKYSYKETKINQYSELLTFLEDIAEYSIFQKMILRGNREVLSFKDIKSQIVSKLKTLNIYDYCYKEKNIIINLIKDNNFDESEYGKLVYVALNLKDVYRYSYITIEFPENVLFHQYVVTVASILFANYCNKEFKENFDIYTILTKSLFHDFTEYKGTEIITGFKNYNDITKKMFAEIEENDEKELKEKLGEKLYTIISGYKEGTEGFISEMLDKMLGIMKIWIETGYFSNYTAIKAMDAIFQNRFKIFLKVENICEIKKKDFYLNLLRECYIYIKEHLLNIDQEYLLKYFTKEELQTFREAVLFVICTPASCVK